MRIRIVFALKNRGAYVPFHHQFLLAQTIKGLVMLGKNEKYFSFTQYNFSGLKGQIKISRKGLHFYSSKVTLVFSSSDKEFIDYFKSVLFQQKELLIGNMQLVPESMEPEEPVSITDSVKFLCISPIVLVPASFNDESGKRFINPELDEFSDLLYDSTIARMEASGKFTAEQLADFYKFQLVADKEYINRIQASHKKFARIYPLYDLDVKYEVRGYTFPFTLYAPQPVQQFVYENGLGHFSHKGFGMLDVANASSIRNEADLEVNYA
ncbi:MAG: CRISPR-associated endoribonuclease Cas6 [Cyclobacteriaceae bacterium]|nr:CRISPR-associated endoribonuclease Cas6 [Cyclobacteriaceae bacterium]